MCAKECRCATYMGGEPALARCPVDRGCALGFGRMCQSPSSRDAVRGLSANRLLPLHRRKPRRRVYRPRFAVIGKATRSRPRPWIAVGSDVGCCPTRKSRSASSLASASSTRNPCRFNWKRPIRLLQEDTAWVLSRRVLCRFRHWSDECHDSARCPGAGA